MYQPLYLFFAHFLFIWSGQYFISLHKKCKEEDNMGIDILQHNTPQDFITYFTQSLSFSI
jgi:hypothetical protein